MCIATICINNWLQLIFTPMHTREKQKISLLRLTARLLKDVCLCFSMSGGRGKGLGGDWGGETHEQRSWCPLKIAKRWRLLFTPVTSHNCNHSASRKVKVARKPVRLHIPKPCKKQKGSITVHGILFSLICRRSIMQCLDHTIARHFRYTEFERQSYFECEWKVKVNKKKTSHIC